MQKRQNDRQAEHIDEREHEDGRHSLETELAAGLLCCYLPFQSVTCFLAIVALTALRKSSVRMSCA